MKKVLLIEDRTERQLLFMNETKIDLNSYSDILENVTAEKYEKLFAELKDGSFNFNNYRAIIVHKSAFSDDNKMILHTIRSYCKEHEKPLILFSGGISANYYDKTEYEIMEINSKDFYSDNLKLFLDNIEQMNLLILSYGANWKLNILLNTIEKINNFMGSNEDEDILFEEFVNFVHLQLLDNLDFDYYSPELENGWTDINEIQKIADSVEKYIRESILYEK